MQIIDSHGDTAELLQLKATESVGYLRDTLERYPDIAILTTKEAAQDLGPNDMVIDSRMSEADLERAINVNAGNLDHGYLDQFWDSFNPLLPLLIIAATQGYQIAVNKQRVGNAMEVAKARAARGMVASAAGAVVKVVSGSWLASALGVLTAGILFDRSQNIDELVEALKSRNHLLAARASHYQALIARA
jgi:hypothetical protein